ncbi:hypothetical protein [Nostoc linckia]|nr:hypothetical protein [Nostoc linckia]
MKTFSLTVKTKHLTHLFCYIYLLNEMEGDRVNGARSPLNYPKGS